MGNSRDIGDTEQSDEALMALFARTLDEDTFRLLAQRHYRDGMRIAERLLGDHGKAQDAVQTALLRVARSSGSYRSTKLFAPWFHRILRNACIDMLRAETRRNEAMREFAEILPVLAEDGVAAHRAGEILDGLARDDSLLLEFRFSRGMSFREIASRLDCSLDAAKKRVQRILIRLRS